MFNKNITHLIATVIIAVSVILSSFLISRFFVKVRKEKNLSVKGYAEQLVTGDTATFSVLVRGKGPNLEDSYNNLSFSCDKVIAKLLLLGFKDEEVTFGGIYHDNVFRKNDRGVTTGELSHVETCRNIEIISKRVELISAKYRELDSLIGQGVNLTTSAPQYFITDLDRYKMALMKKATVNGFERARALSENSGGKIGRLLAAKQGVIQITSPYSTETSHDGIYDTASLQKNIKVVVTLEYLLE